MKEVYFQICVCGFQTSPEYNIKDTEYEMITHRKRVNTEVGHEVTWQVKGKPKKSI